MTDRDWTIWASGFFDGEGCVSVGRAINVKVRKSGLVKRYESYQLSIIVAQRYRQPLDKLVELFGGHVSDFRVHGSIYWQWKKYGNEAAEVLKQLLPYLLVKRSVAEVGVEFEVHRATTNNGKNARNAEDMEVLRDLYAQAKVLNARSAVADYTKEAGRPILPN